MATLVCDSTSSNPYYGGQIEVQATAECLRVRWLGESGWSSVEWWEVMQAINCRPESLAEEIQWERERGYNEGLAEALDEMREKAASEAFQKGYSEGRYSRLVGPVGQVVEMKPKLRLAE